MTKAELIALFSREEDHFLERKSEGVKPEQLRRTAVAFANSVPDGRVAVLFIGVDDHTGRPKGVSNTDVLQKRVRKALGDCYPPIAHSSEVISVEGQNILAVVFPPSATKPHFAGQSYVRVGSESPVASREQLDELIFSRTDPCRTLLGLRNQTVTVHAIGYKLGDQRPLSDSHYRERHDCHVTNCTAHTVSLQSITSGRNFTEPLAWVTITHDHERNRPLLILSHP